ncbi:A-factor biosynthesis protein [Streptomyces sp. HUCO-GS316]|uniref:ScbA/BarX family gamma-butyrolactone biosynthesis protein n=1 Tax=Streptomyces sp. HUCO-GS316 TaxID=2692198 RepID=UPI001368C918|nr:ScbA/BarX family gamma-butyrolactone biosynthesis protein [Streptomyces sp. HUCO-GS316]MXM68911.1 A-factor biosynthesis protein [Streptomyces sp. HUCO-GS316]
MSPLKQAVRPDSLSPEKEAELFERTVPRGLVHRSAVSEVLLTGLRPKGRDKYHIGAQWARGHSYYGPVAGRWHDPMLLGESIRQAGLLLAHEALGIPLDYHFLTQSTSFELTERGARLAGTPADVVLGVTLRDIRCRGAYVSSFALDVLAHRDGELMGSGHAASDCVGPAVYRRLRGARAEARPAYTLIRAVRPDLVGRLCEFDVVLGRPEVEDAEGLGGVHLLRVDATHPVLFDHPVDHVPGMLLLEAARQAALSALGLPRGLLVGCEASFRRYVEFDSPCLVSASKPTVDAEGGRTLTVQFHQAGSVAATVAVTVLDGESGPPGTTT